MRYQYWYLTGTSTGTCKVPVPSVPEQIKFELAVAFEKTIDSGSGKNIRLRLLEKIIGSGSYSSCIVL